MSIFMKKYIKTIVLSILLLFFSIQHSFMVGYSTGTIFPGNICSVSAAKETFQFPDVPKSAWYFDDLQYILNDPRHIFAGYPDGTFRPNDTLTVDMYIKLIVTVMGHNVENGQNYWASTYINKAIDEGYVVLEEDYLFTYKTNDDPYAGYKRPINRADMALIAGRALDDITDNSDYRDPIAVSSLIKDYQDISHYQKWNVVKCYDLGILTGFPDGEFKPDNILTRAEAVAVIRRLIDPSARKKVDLPTVANPTPTPIPVNELNRPAKKDLGSGVVEVEGVKFDPETDIVNPSNGAMGILKAEEFVGVALEYLTFYEHEGKARVKGYIPELPEGYEWDFALHCNVKEPDDRGFYGGIYTTEKDEIPEFRLPLNGRTFDMPLYTDKGNIDSLYFNFEIRTIDNASGGEFFISLTLQKYSRYDSVGGHSLVDVFDAKEFIEW
jgi:hypothetical protein